MQLLNRRSLPRLKIATATCALMIALIPVQSFAQCGEASWYALTSKTASGERMNPEDLTAAHIRLPLGQKIKVTHQKTGRTVTVRINDRMPATKGRIIDLSKGAARQLGMIQSGVAPVCIE